MKLFSLLTFVLAVIALFAGFTDANPKVNVDAIRKGGRAIRKGLGVVGAAGTAHEVYEQVKNRRQG
ncbi:unnamed protein product [Pieris macdunnoughi]|uniref:Moricin n=1 Tax=Pieris macdunnoughi TaxID=345717 RepID=A0A821S735_9NEOP|nr:unnamed protein product [Pieris macdunnoughi]